MNWLRIRVKLLRLIKKEQGSFTLESTFVFPILITLILLFIIFGMYMYQKVVLYYAASSTAERAAFGWDNSNRDPRNGMLKAADFDSLYWRIGEDGMLSSLFGLGGESAEAVAALPLEPVGEGEERALPQRKLEQAVHWLEQSGAAFEGQIGYANSVLKRTIEVKLKQPLSAESAEQGWLKREAKTVASASIVAPAEFIRSVDLVRYYAAKYANRGGAAGQANAQAGEILAPYGGANGR